MYLPTRWGGRGTKASQPTWKKVVKRKGIIQLKKIFLDGNLKEF